jgi:hypothetical protein
MSNSRPTGANPLDAIGAFFDVTGGLGDFIANGNPDPDSIPGVIQQRYRDHCDSWSRGELWIANINPADRAVLSSMCNPWLESQGSGDPVAVPGDQIEDLNDEDLTQYGGARLEIIRASFGFADLIENVTRYELSANQSTGTRFVARWDCAGSYLGNSPYDSINILEWGVCGGATSPPPEPPPPTISPNPNPRPDPGLDPEDEPFEDPDGRTITPMPGIPNPWGDPIQLPNLPIPNPFAESPAGGAGGAGGNPNAGPEPEPSDEIDGTPDGEDDEFGEPPEGHIWIGFTVRVSPQGLSHGSWANTGNEPVYREPTGVARPVFDFEGDKVLGNPVYLSQELSSYWIEAAGLPLSGARVSILGSETYSITPYSQPIEEAE